MARLRSSWRSGRDLPFVVLCVALVLGLVRSVDQPSLALSLAGTSLDVVPADVAFAALGVLALARVLGRGALPRPARAVTLAAAAFSAWLLLSSAANGIDALVGAAKFLQYGVLALGLVLFVQRRSQLWAILTVLVAVTAAADVYALIELASVRDRQDSFLGSHDFAALGTLVVAVGVAAFHAHRRLPLALGVALVGAVAVALGAALASLLGLWLAAAALLATAASRRSLTWSGAAFTLALAVAVTAVALPLRSGDLGFVEGGGPSLGAESAGGWSQRLIYAYLGGRVFLDNPVVGTGWHGELPPEEWARYLDDARRAFPDQPPHYFPAPDDDLIPQQAYDQVLFELGLVGALLFLGLAALAVRTAVRVVRAWPRGGPDEALAYLPAAWLAALAGAFAGAALYGGIPLAALFWLGLGLVAAAPSLVPAPPAAPPAPVRNEPLLAAR